MGLGRTQFYHETRPVRVSAVCFPILNASMAKKTKQQDEEDGRSATQSGVREETVTRKLQLDDAPACFLLLFNLVLCWLHRRPGSCSECPAERPVRPLPPSP